MTTAFTATAEPTNSPPRTLLELTYTGQTSAVIMRTDPDGADRPVRLGEPATLDGSGTWVGYDYESWFGEPSTYTATTAAGTLTAGPVTLDVDKIWLRHPGVPSLSMEIDFQGEGEPVRPVNQAILEPLNRRAPIVVTDGRRRAKRDTITIRTKTDDEAAALLALLDDVAVLLLDLPISKNYGMDRHQYLALGDLRQARLRPDYYPHPWRIWTAPYIVVDRPAGGLQSERTYASVLADLATYTAVRTTYGTYTDLLTGN
ncbi:MAG TPA: hypothetical protein VFX60_19335 [Micromonospora sp.]|nr:hypothetical protein [Micromonospora sp.]